MSTIVPGVRPSMSKDEALKRISSIYNSPERVKLLGVRGYFDDSEQDNKIGVYDDAIFIISGRIFKSFNANVDPSKDGITIAHLKTGGPYLYKIGLHNMKAPYKALRQYGSVTVLRNGIPVTDSPENRFYIDIHKGGWTTTSSLGCQTIYPEQWDEFLSSVENELNYYNQQVIPYFLC